MTPEQQLALETDNKRLRGVLQDININYDCDNYSHKYSDTDCRRCLAGKAICDPPPPVSGILGLAKAADEYMQAKNMMYGADCDAGLAEVSYIVCRKHAQLQLAHEALTPEERAILEGVEL